MKRNLLAALIAMAIPTEGVPGETLLREAATTELGQITDLVRSALKRNYGLGENGWVCIEAIYPDRVVVERDGKNFQFTYTIDDANNVVLGAATEVVMTATPVTETTVREAAATEMRAVNSLVLGAIRKVKPDIWDVIAMYPDRAVVAGDDRRQYAYPYTIDDSNQVTLGTPYEVISQHVPASSTMPAREARATHTPPKSGNAAGDLQGTVFIEALQAPEGQKPSRYLVRVIKAGTSLNNVTYPRNVLREAAPLFDGARVFVKSDAEHLKGGGKDVRQLVGRLSDSKFVEAGVGEIQSVMDVFDSADVAPMLREAVQRGMTDLFGLSIDASGKSKKTGEFREAISLTKVASVDLIIEPGAGGQLIRFVEAHNPEEDTMLRSQMITEISARDAKRAEGLADASDADVLAAYREAVGTAADKGTEDAVTKGQVDERFRMIEARAEARVLIAESKLPLATQVRLNERFREAASFTTENVTASIEDERKYLGQIVDGSKITGLGHFIEAGESRAEKMQTMFDDFFDHTKKVQSFRECYIEFTGDRGVTGKLGNCDMSRMREAAGERGFREAISASTFGDTLGDSITRAMIRLYGASDAYTDWRWMCDVVPITDFRTQERTRVGGYGNLATVAENGAYPDVNSPTDEKATYAVTKRGGVETLSLEAIANDDVGLIRRIPQMLATAAGRTVFEFVYDFLRSNAVIYDTKALFHADHANIGTAALDEDSFAAARLRMKQQTEKDSGKRLGITLKHLVIPSELEQVAYDTFVRFQNLDKTFVQSRSPTVHVVDYWTDTNNWFAAADNAQVPLIEMGFYGGNEDPELFVQDTPNQGSLFSNDQIKYKIRHIYSGAVRDYRGFDGSIVAA
jgi:hypothetical protein